MVDRTEFFRRAVIVVAETNPLYNEAAISRIKSALIMPKPLEKSPFTLAALQTLGHIRKMQEYMASQRKDYLDPRRCSKRDRDSIEHEIGLFVKDCQKRIENLKNSIASDKRTLWQGAVNVDLNAHRHGIVLILSEDLHATAAAFDKLRAAWAQATLNQTTLRPAPRLSPRVPTPDMSYAGGSNEETALDEEVRAAWRGSSVQMQESTQSMLDDETHLLQEELSSLIDASQATERKMQEVAALNHLFATYVLQQAEQIELLYQQAVDATRNVSKGNKELVKAVDRRSSSRIFLLMVFIVLPLSLLYMHWFYS